MNAATNFLRLLDEGVHDKGIFKAIFLAGGPGSGKTYHSSTAFGFGPGDSDALSSRYGLRFISSDQAFEFLMKREGIDPSELADEEMSARMNDTSGTVFAGRDSVGLRPRAKQVTAHRLHLASEGRLGVVIEGTGKTFDKIKRQKAKLDALGYDCYMLAVNTTLELAQERNMRRARKLTPKDVEVSWGAVQHNLGAFQTMFSRANFLLFDSVADVEANEQNQELLGSHMEKILALPPSNPIALKWIADQGGDIRTSTYR